MILEVAMPHEEMLTVKEVSAVLKLHPETVRRWIKSGRLKAVSMGSDKGGWRIPASEIERYTTALDSLTTRQQ